MNKLKALETILKKAKPLGLGKFKFKCYSDNILTFGYTDGYYYHELNIMCDSDMFPEMSIIEILNLKRIGFIDYRIYNKIENKVEDVAMYSSERKESLN